MIILKIWLFIDFNYIAKGGVKRGEWRKASSEKWLKNDAMGTNYLFNENVQEGCQIKDDIRNSEFNPMS